jgi:tetratricopeptide (TPR) repeat protein
MLSAGLWVAVLLGPAPAQEPPHLEFVHGLRARQYPDLALEYLLKLRQRPEYVKDVKLLLETAKTRLELANLEADTGKRLVIFDDARRDLEKFLKENPEHPLRADAELQAASLAALQGKTQLSKALRMDPESAQPDALKARGLLEQAGRRLQEVAARIDGQLAKYSAEDANLPKEQLDEKKSLEHARLEVELGLGVNKYDQAQTFIDRGVNKELEQRTLTVKEGMKFLEKAARRDPKDSLAWEAKAWLGRCLYETGDPRAAEKKLNEVVDEKSKDAEGGQRLARFFLLPIYLEGNRGREDPREVVIREATQWLTDYPRSATTPEGSGVRFQLAKAHAGLGLDAKTVAGPKRDHLAKARMLCKELERSENDFTDRARQLQITLIEREGGFTKPVASLPNFDDCLVRAQFEAYQIHKDAAKAKTPKEADEAR